MLRSHNLEADQIKMENEETIYIWRALSPALLVNFLRTAAKRLADDDPMWETSIGVTFRFHRHPCHSVSPADSSVEVARRVAESSIRVSSRPVLQPQFALTMMVTGADQRTTVTLASRDGLPDLTSCTCNVSALAECMARRHASEAATTGSRAVTSTSRAIQIDTLLTGNPVRHVISL